MCSRNSSNRSQIGQRSCFINNDVSFKQQFNARFSPAQVVAGTPYGGACACPESCEAYGCVSFKFADDLSNVTFRVNVSGVEDLTSIRVIVGEAGSVGEDTAYLYGKDAEKQPKVEKPSFSTHGSLTNSDLISTLESPSGAVNIADLLNLVRLGMIYVEVYSESCSVGVVRAQIFG